MFSWTWAKQITDELIVIDIFVKCWNIRHCTKIFDIFTRKFFDVHLTKERDFLTRLRDYFRCWLSDECYDVVVLKELLKNVFEADQRMFDINKEDFFECKIAVTATTLSDAFVYLFINYNDDEIKERNCDSLKNALDEEVFVKLTC